jgi:uncharacterized membrane protein YphA (DoxX/SURF4 family)
MRDWKISLWAGRAVLALFFAYAGFLKLSRTPEALAAMGWHWTVDVPPSLITFIGIMEVLGAIGIIFPAALRLLPWLATLSAAGMLLLQLAAVALHLSRGETGVLWLNAILVLVAGAVAWIGFNRDARG